MQIYNFLGAFLLAAGVSSQTTEENAPPVAIDLYYETLCPYSIAYFTGQLYPTWLELSDIMQVQLFPFGNANYVAKPDGGYLFTCQHGPDECKGNMIHACAQKEFNDIYVEMDFVNCLLSASYPPDAGEECALAVGKPWAPIDFCVNRTLGENLLHGVGVITENLVPPHTYVPWIVVNNQHSDALNSACQADQKIVVCQTYTGTPPDACGIRPRGNSVYVGRSKKMD